MGSAELLYIIYSEKATCTTTTIKMKFLNFVFISVALAMFCRKRCDACRKAKFFSVKKRDCDHILCDACEKSGCAFCNEIKNRHFELHQESFEQKAKRLRKKPLEDLKF